jgi:hypothetical protein
MDYPNSMIAAAARHVYARLVYTWLILKSASICCSTIAPTARSQRLRHTEWA